ncbi:HAMP domain-containing sensor histidine kinase [Haloarcula sp. 1CSR25-25]|uniref:HAMP domain-containing sensor histidine kinase n=1 Tax=Haloarcula sp. 1CSR25-25 TaxID=2862545 RepID=UPI002895B3EB|nr:HAMP domain-containing sensor histidine kinase [Haloarcula sp. 1CSR25-25]MDT3434552.1 HAMP domain-containing histidine kinase [Haloarcula sp. 1CSR25-25]
MTTKRVLGCGTLTLTGGGLAAVSARQLLGGTSGVVETVIAVFGLLIGLGFLAGSGVLLRSDLRTKHVLRVAGWNLLGVVATSAVLVLILLYQRSSGGTLLAPLFSGTIVVGVSATAHVLIGVNDVRRIRARNLARQREKTTVMNRLIRHDLKHSAQVLLGLGDVLSGTPDPDVDDIGDRVRTVGSDLAEIDSQVGTVTDLIEAEEVDREPVALDSLVEESVAELRPRFPDATISVHADDSARALAGDPLEIAVSELLENALVHGGDPAAVEIRVEAKPQAVTVSVSDDGPGIPDTERELVSGEQAVTQLTHSNGLGLWLSKWVVEAYGGTLVFEATDGATVTLRLDRAA